MVKKIFFKETEVAANVALNAAKVSGEATTTAASTALAGTEASAWGITAVVKALASLPFPLNLAAGAATLAAVVAVGAKMLGGGGGGGSVPTSQQRQERQGTGTVLGDDDAKSESLLNAMEGLADNSNIALEYSSDMLATLRSINDGIAGMATTVLRASGLRGTRLDEIAAGVGSSRSLLGFSKSSTTLMDQGLFIAPGQSVGGIRGGGIDAQKYTETETTKSSWWGLSKKTSRNTSFEELEAAISAQFTRTIADIAAGVEQTAGAFGVAGDDLLAQINGFTVDIGMISLKGLNGEEIEAELAAVFGQLGDNMAKAVIPGLDDFQRIGEGYFETAVRVASATENAAFQLERFGLTAIGYADVVKKQGDVGAEIVRQTILAAESTANGMGEIIQALSGSAEEIGDTYAALLDVRAGLAAVGITGDVVTRSLVRGARDLDALQSGIDSYFENYFTASERLAAETGQMQTELSKLGLSLPIGIAGFRAMVGGIDQTTEAGQLLLGKVLTLAPAFYELTEAMDAALEANRELLAQGRSARSDLLASINALRQYGQQLQATSDGIVSAINNLRGQAAQALASATATAQQNLAAVDAANQQAQQALQSASSTLSSALQGVSAAIAQAAAQVQDAQDAVAAARSAITAGYLEALAGQAAVRAAITDAYIAAQDELLDAQQRLTDAQERMARAMRSAGNDVLETLQKLAGTSAGSGNVSSQYAAQWSAFESLVQRALSGDAAAAGKVSSAGMDVLAASRARSSTRDQFVADDIKVRQMLAQVLEVTGSDAGTGSTEDADAIAEAQAALATAIEKAAAAQRLAVESGASLTAATVDLAAQYATATVEVARWSSAIAVSGASRTAEQVDILAAYNAALANLAQAQSSHARLLAATQALDLSASQASADSWAGAVAAATTAQTAYVAAQDAAALAGADLQVALAAAAAAGLTLAEIKSPLDLFLESVTAFADAQLVAEAVQADLYESSGNLVTQYNTQVTALGAANAALSDFQSRVASIDLSVVTDTLGDLLADYNGATTAVADITNKILATTYGQQIDALYNEMLGGRDPELDGLLYWFDKALSGYSEADLRTGIANSAEYRSLNGLPAFGAGGWHDGGWAMVGEHGPELAYMPPARVYTAAQTRSMASAAGAGADGSDAMPVVAELRRTHAEARAMYLEMIKRLQNMDLRLKKFDEDVYIEMIEKLESIDLVLAKFDEVGILDRAP